MLDVNPWFAYRCKSGEILFYYNKDTGEHRRALSACWKSTAKSAHTSLADVPIDDHFIKTENIITEDIFVKACNPVSYNTVATETEISHSSSNITPSVATQTEDSLVENVSESVLNEKCNASSKVTSCIGTQTCSPAGEKTLDLSGDMETSSVIQKSSESVLNEKCNASIKVMSSTGTQTCTPAGEKTLDSSGDMETSRVIQKSSGKRKRLDCGSVSDGDNGRSKQPRFDDMIDICQSMDTSDVQSGSTSPYKYRTASRVKLFDCTHCSKAFTSASFLERHLQFHNVVARNAEIPVVDEPNNLVTDQDTGNGDAKLEAESKNRNEEENGTSLDHLNDSGEDSGKVEQQRSESELCPNSVAVYQCRICHQRFNNKEDLTQHSKAHVKTKCFVCKHCNNTFKKLCALRSHVTRMHLGQEPHWCCICDYNFCRKDALLVHMRRQHSVATKNPSVQILNFRCAQCKKGFKTRRKLYGHMSHCSRKCVSEHAEGRQLRQLPARQLPVEELPSDQLPAEQLPVKHKTGAALKKRHSCIHCGTSYLWRKNLVLHLQTCQGYKIIYSRSSRTYICEKCDQQFKTLNSLILHHAKHRNVETDRPKHSCSKCNKTFPKAFFLRKHIENKSCEKKPFQCEHCPKSFNFQKGLNKHLKAHKQIWEKMDAENLVAPSGGATPATKHVEKIFSEDPKGQASPDSKVFQCHICSKMLSCNVGLSNHLTWHKKKQVKRDQESQTSDGERKQEVTDAKESANPKDAEEKTVGHSVIGCKLCSKSFNMESGLKKHLAWHRKTEEKASKESAERSPVENVHRTASSGKSIQGARPVGKPFRCKLCPMRFASVGGLSKHRFWHSKVKLSHAKPIQRPFKCESCPKSFHCRSSLSKHLTWHGKMKLLNLESPDRIPGVKKEPSDQMSPPSEPPPKKSPSPGMRGGKKSKKIVQGGTNVKDYGKLLFKCMECKSDFSNKSNLLRHFTNVHPHDTSFECCLCHDSFNTPIELARHTRRTSRAKQHKCDKCTAQFEYCIELLHHKQKDHETPKKKNTNSSSRASNGKFPCRMCSKTFTCPSNRCRHHKLHKCLKCQKEFPTVEETHHHTMSCLILSK